jgi:phospholipid/cholesterol/gamma-HCH transport system substrate-binding protein
MESSSRKVGLFVFAGLAIIGFLLVNFSKGSSLWRPGWILNVQASNVGSLRPGAVVTMSGVRVGTVEDIRLSDGGRAVLIACRMSPKITLHGDAKIDIEQSGFLGDQYVAVIPQDNSGPVLTDGAILKAREPFNLIETARDAGKLLAKLDSAVSNINSAIGRVDRILLSEQSLIEITNTIASFRHASASTERTLGEIESLVLTNRGTISGTFSNLNHFTARLSGIADQVSTVATNLNEIVMTNRSDLRETLLALKDTSTGLHGIVTDLDQGKGTAGALLKDEQLRLQIDAMVGSLATASSNLAKYGLLYKPRRIEPLTNNTRYSGRGPGR